MATVKTPAELFADAANALADAKGKHGVAEKEVASATRRLERKATDLQTAQTAYDTALAALTAPAAQPKQK